VAHSSKEVLDLIRGWKEPVDPDLSKQHALPPLATFVSGSNRLNIYGTEVYLGRFHPQQGPVDLLFYNFEDHEIYKFAAPHVRLVLERNQWYLRPKAPNCWTSVNGVELGSTSIRTPISTGDTIRIGCVDFVFEDHSQQLKRWLEKKKELFRSATQTTLFLKRGGEICGPRFLLGDLKKVILGRSFNPVYEKKYGYQQPDWNLSSLLDVERKFIAFRHLAFFRDGPEWTVESLSTRQKVYINRRELSSTGLLTPGDEISLGNVCFHFHDPSNFEASTTRKTADLPAAIDWGEGSRTDVTTISSEDEDSDV